MLMCTFRILCALHMISLSRTDVPLRLNSASMQHRPALQRCTRRQMARPQLRAAITVCAVALQALVDELGGSITDMFWLEIGALERQWAKPVACPVLDFEVCCDSA